MQIIIGVLAVLQMFVGINTLRMADSAMHEIYSGVMFGSGTICLGLAFIIHKMR